MVKNISSLKSILVFIILFSFTSSLIFAQKASIPKEPTTWEIVKNDGKLMFGGLKYTYSRPGHWDQDDWALAAGVVIGTAGLNIIDEDANRFFSRNEVGTPQILKDFGWYFGSPQNNYGVTGGIYLFGLFTKNYKVRRAGILMISAASAAGLIQTVTKTAAGRFRPSRDGLTGTSRSFKPFGKGGRYHSFPSGHTILSFTTFYALSKQFDNPWVKAGFYTVGMISPISRLLAGAHWLTDVALSMAITIAVVDSVDKYLDKEMSNDPMRRSKDGNKVSWNLQLGAGSIGLIGTF